MDIPYFSTVLSLLADGNIGVTGIDPIPGGFGSPRVDRLRLTEPFKWHRTLVAKYVPEGAGGEVSAYTWFVVPFEGADAGPVATVLAEEGGWWIFLADYGDETLTRSASADVWRKAVEWLARFQTATLPAPPSRFAPRERFLPWDRRGIVRRFRKADRRLKEYATGGEFEVAGATVDSWRKCRRVAEDTLRSAPGGFETRVHGDFKDQNLLVVRTDGKVRIRPIDWANAGVGSPFLDLHTLVRDLPCEEARALEQVFFEERRRTGSAPWSGDEFSRGMHVAALVNSLFCVDVLCGYIVRDVNREESSIELVLRQEQMEEAAAGLGRSGL